MILNQFISTEFRSKEKEKITKKEIEQKTVSGEIHPEKFMLKDFLPKIEPKE